MLHDDAAIGPGLVGQAFVLDGDGDFIEVPHDPALNLATGDFTVALWVRFNDTAGEQVLVEKWIQRGSADSDGWTLTKLEGDILRLAMPPGTDTETNVDSAPLTLPTDTWLHVAATRQDGEVTLFMNGQPIASGLFAGNLNSSASLKFGHRGSPSDTPGSEDDNGFFLNGRIDEVQLLVGRALHESFIRAIYDAGTLGQCSVTDTIPNLPNLAGEKPVRVSAFLPDEPPQNAVDREESGWNSGDYAPQWLEIDLQRPATVTLVRLVVNQYPAGETVHQLWGGGPGEELRLLHEFRGLTDTNHVLAFQPETPLANLQTIRVRTTESPSWVAWNEVEVYGTHDDPLPDSNYSPPSENPVTVQPLTAAPALSVTPLENPVDTQMAVQLLYPKLAGAFIELQAEPLWPGLWTRLQWQDAFGAWHDIEGWQGSFNPDQRVLWYVGAEQLGEGPFRWLVYESQEGDLLAVSQSFDLPSRGGEVLHVEVSLPALDKAVTVATTLSEAPVAAATSAPWLRAHPVWDSVDAWDWPQDAVLHLTIDDPATPAAPDFEMDLPGEVDPDLGSVWFDFAGLYDLKPDDEVTVSDGTTTRQLIVSSLMIDAVDVAANTASGTAEAGASVRLPAPPPPDQALFVTADGSGAWAADFDDIGFDLVAGTTVIAEVYDEDGDLTSFAWALVIPLEENVAAARPVVVTTNGADDDRENPGVEPADITDGRLDYLPAEDAQDDGVVGYVNDDLNQRMVITVTIDLQGAYDISRIRYNMGDVQRAETWNADLMTTPFGSTPTNPGTPGHGAWTEHSGSATLSSVTIVLEKTRVSYETDWLFIGEIEVYGIPSGS
jgi:hypothetical protein